MANNQADEKIKQALADVCPDREQWIFTNQPHGDCLNRSLRNCLCGHRANYLYTYQHEEHYILLGVCCAKKYFTVDARVKNEIAQHDNRDVRYCEICEKRMCRGVHMFENKHYTCYIRAYLLPKAKKALLELDKNDEHYNELRFYLLYRITTMEAKLAKGTKKWTYNNKATVNAPIITPNIENDFLSNQDLLKVNDEIDQVIAGNMPVLFVGQIREDILNTKIDTAYGRQTLNYMLSTQNRVSYLIEQWKAGQFNTETKKLIHTAVDIKIEEKENT